MKELLVFLRRIWMTKRTYLITIALSVMFFSQVWKLSPAFRSSVSSSKFNDSNISISSFPTPQSSVQFKNILIWTPYFGKFGLWKKVFRRNYEDECAENGCKIFIRNKKKKDFNAIFNADAILFNANDLGEPFFDFWGKKVLPKSRLPRQIYIFFSLEPPPNVVGINLSKFNHFFNWTMTYRRDSDIIVPYGQIYKWKAEGFGKFVAVTEEELQQKKLAVWMASHCPTDSRREELVKHLQNFVNIDVFGKCGNLTCGKRTTVLNLVPGIRDPCEELIKHYVFYMALENALCEDYVTEKFYRSLTLGVIPVVLGSPSYSLMAPPHSYIDIRDFESLEQLALYMMRVAKNVTLYNEYFEWRDDFDVEVGHPYKPFTCDLCSKLHSADTATFHKSYESIERWYSKEARCHPWKDGKENVGLRANVSEFSTTIS